MIYEVDKRHHLPVFSKVCLFCKYFHMDSSMTCQAFPDGIPEEIWLAKNNHTEPFEGDHGLQYKDVRK